MKKWIESLTEMQAGAVGIAMILGVVTIWITMICGTAVVIASVVYLKG